MKHYSQLFIVFFIYSIQGLDITEKIFKENLSTEELRHLLSRRIEAIKAPFYEKKGEIENSYLIKFKSVRSMKRVMNVIPRSLSFDSSFHINHVYDSIHTIAVTMSEDTLNVFRLLHQVEYVENDAIVTIAGIESKLGSCFKNTQLNAEWCLSRSADSSQSSTFRWPRTAGKGVTVYILDTGIEDINSDIGGKATLGRNLIVTENNTDLNGHGTACASLVAGNIYGIAKNARIVGVKVINATGVGRVSDVMAGIKWVIDEQRVNSIITLSLTTVFMRVYNDIVNEAAHNGYFVVSAAGNDFDVPTDACNTSPASAQSAFAVAASTEANTLLSSSNYGRCVKMIAPGENCNATETGQFGTFVNFSGTSAAASLVAGWAAVIQGCMKFKTPNLLAAYLIKESTKGFIQGNLRGTPNNFIHVDCPDFCDPDFTRDQ